MINFARTNYCSMDKQIFNSIKKVLSANLPKDAKAMLYGSQARGDAHSGSDWDLLILLNKKRIELNDYDMIAYPLRELGWDLGEIINPILYSFDDWQKQSA